ncbi:MAG TPA: HEAT repeat domain-containing protein [Polyangia bacterium]|nr:HEAT repeat domain-containing protein [Polyangia bacterium]
MTPPAARAPAPSPEAERLEQIARLARGGDVRGLMPLLDDPNWATRRAVVAALAAAGPASLEPLCEALRNARDSEGRIAAVVDALSAATADPLPLLAAMTAEADADVAVLADVAQILGRRRSVAAMPTVAALSRHENDNVAVAAIEALGRIGGRAAVDSLVEAVGSGNFFRVFPAIDVLGRSGDPRAVAPLTALLDQPQYAGEAARALGRTGDIAAVAPLVRYIARASAAAVRLAAEALSDLHQRYCDRFDDARPVETSIKAGAEVPGFSRHLLLALQEGDPTEQAAICFVLGVIQDPSTTSALTALLDGPPLVAAAAAAALGGLAHQAGENVLAGIRTGSPTHRKALLPHISGGWAAADVVACLRDEDPDVRVLACDALARMGAVGEVAALFPVLGDPDTRVSYAAVGAIQSLGSNETERLALEAARSPDVRVRRAAVRILTYFGSTSALGVFLSALEDPDERVREAAVQALPLMDDPRAFETLLACAKSKSEKTRAAAMRSLGQSMGDLRASAYLMKGIRDPDPWVRYYACQSLGKLAFEPAAEAIIGLLDDPAGQVRIAAIEALSCLKSEPAIAALSQAATDTDEDVQRAAIVGLGVAQHASALPLVIQATRAANPATRLVALSALAGFRDPAVLVAFRDAAGDPEESVRTAAIGFLAAMKGIAATRVLVGLLRSAASERVLAALALHVEGRVAGLVAALEEADDETAPFLVSALARLRRPEANAALVGAMTMSNLAARKAAPSALAVLRNAEAVAALRRAAAEDREPEVRQICSLLLAR